MKLILSVLLGVFILTAVVPLSVFAGIGIGISGGYAATSKINYAANKSAFLFSGRLLYATNHFEGGLASKFYILNDPAYSSMADLGIIANGKISLNPNSEDKGSFIVVGAGLGYGWADFGSGMGLGLQIGYGYTLNETVALVAEFAPRYYDFKIDPGIYDGKWKGFPVTTVDRFITLPLTLGLNITL